MYFRGGWGEDGAVQRGRCGFADLDPDNHLMLRGHNIESMRPAEVDDDARNGRLRLEASDANIEHLFGMYGNILDGRFEQRVGKIKHQTIGILEQEWTG
jgi:hypothetical protein